MLQECIWGSLTLRAQRHIALNKDEYTVNGLCCAPLLFNLIKRTVTGNLRTTIRAIRSQLNHIDGYAAEVEGNVEMITGFFTEHLRQLKTFGATLDNPMEILFKGLLAVPCEDFHHYISNKKNMYYDASLTCTPEELVLMAQQEYMLMKTKAATPTTQSPETTREECIGHGCATRLRSSHQNQVNTTTANMFIITLAFTAHCCHGEQSSTQLCTALKLVTKTNLTSKTDFCDLSPEDGQSESFIDLYVNLEYDSSYVYVQR